MGLRGRGARSVKGRCMYQPEPQPWEVEGLNRAERVMAFLETLPITAGLLAGSTLKLLPFQRDFLRKVYRTDRKGRRLVRQAVLSTPRKNGKSSLSAGLCLCHLLGPEAEQRGQLYSAALDQCQASLVLNEMIAIIEATPWMLERVNIKRQVKEIHDLQNGSMYKALSAKVGSKMGLSASFAIYDEYGQATNRELYDALYTSMGARKEPLMLTISTQAATDAMPLSKLIDYGKKVESGEIKDKSFAMTLLCAPDDADIYDPKVWKACNPALGKFLSMDDFKAQAEMVRNSPSLEPAFLNLRLNRRCSQQSAFVSERLWKACSGFVPDEDLSGPCYGALDLSTRVDLTAFVAFWPECGAVRVWCWLPEVGLQERQHTDGCPYVEWAKTGALLTTTGKTIDRRAVARIVADVCQKYQIKAVAYDRWRFAEWERVLSEDLGIDAQADLHFVPWGQGYQDMAPAVDAFEAALVEGKLRHGGHPVLTMCASGAVVSMDPAGNRKLEKRKSRCRIDALQALCMAAGLAEKHRQLELTISAEDAKEMLVEI